MIPARGHQSVIKVALVAVVAVVEAVALVDAAAVVLVVEFGACKLWRLQPMAPASYAYLQHG